MSGADRGQTGMRNARIAAIDIGTNSLRLIVAEVAPDGNYRVLDDEKDLARIGQGLGATGLLSDDAMRRAAVAVAGMKGIAEGYGVSVVRAIATSAVREAVNGPEFCEMVADEAGIDVEVVSPEEEARLAYRSAAYAFDLSSCNAAVVDIGGGSTEVVLASGGVVESIWSLPLGAVRLTEGFLSGDAAVDDAAFEAMLRHIQRTMREAFGRLPFVPQFIVGTGGTFTTLAGVAMHRDAGATAEGMLPFALRGYEMQRADIRHLLEYLRKLTTRARTRVPGLSPDRADIIVAGAAIVDSVMKRLRVNTLRVHDRGIRDGLLLTMIDDLHPSLDRRTPQPVDRWQSVRQFAQACRYEEHHAHHVADLSTQIYDQVSRRIPSFAEECGGLFGRDLLKAAGLLHDVGYFINYARHHKHSYHIIIHSELFGFSHREIELIANLARYHRRSPPRLKHPNFAKLSKADRKLVRRLAAILRVADGLDRSHTQAVHRIDLALDEGVCVFAVEANEEPTVDLWGVERKSGLFEEEFGVRCRFVWAGVQKAPQARPAEAAPVNGALR